MAGWGWCSPSARHFRAPLWCPMGDGGTREAGGTVAESLVELCWVRPKRGDREMVVDGGGRFSPAGIDGVHTLTLLFSSSTAHDRAEGDPM